MNKRLFRAMNRKTLVNFRVSQEELDQLIAAAEITRCRSLSEFVRSAVFRAADEVECRGADPRAAQDPVVVRTEQQSVIRQINTGALPKKLNSASAPDPALPVEASSREGALVDRILMVFEDALRSAREATN